MIGASGLALTTVSEGLRNKPYLDPVGIPTVCYGHTGPDVVMGRWKYTDQQCKDILLVDIAAHQEFIVPGRAGNCIADAPLNQNQLDAVTDFVFNVGGEKFCRSSMARYLKVGNYKAASNEFHRWVYGMVDGKAVQLPGLIKRRTEEQKLFDTPMPVNRVTVAYAKHGGNTGVSSVARLK